MVKINICVNKNILCHYIVFMSKLNKILIENISSDKLIDYFYEETNRNYKHIKYDNVCEIFHNEINKIDLYGFNSEQVIDQNYAEIIDLFNKGVLIKNLIKPQY